MKLSIKILVITAAMAAVVLVSQPVDVVGQLPARVNRTALPEVENLTGMREDNAPEATGIPRADLVIKDMCYEDPQESLSYIGVLIANIGTVDAGPFDLGIEYVGASGSSRLGLDKLDGLKAGEERWMTEAHICCGWAPRSLVYASESFVAIADPRYWAKDMFGRSGEVKPVIPESNESNNKMSGKKSELRSCSAVPKADRATPTKVQPLTRPTKIDPAKPPRP